MKHFLVALLASCAFSACVHGYVTSVTVSDDGNSVEARLVGTGAHVVAAGDTLDIRDGQVFVNGESFGECGSGQSVLYRVENGKHELQVDGVVRQAKPQAR